MIQLSDLQKLSGAQLLSQTHDQFLGVATDSRKDLTGQLFVALKGEAHDSHDYFQQAVENGAVGVLGHRPLEDFGSLADELQSKVTWVQVPDTLVALQELGRNHRRQWGGFVLGVTGSNGKTSVKEFTASIVGSAKKVHRSQGSFNNHWGVPLTLLELQPEHQVAVVEMGMNHAGEITQLVAMAEPDAVVVNNVGQAHLGHFKSVEGIAAAKEEIYSAQPRARQAIFNGINPHTSKMFHRWSSQFEKVWTFGAPDSDVYLQIANMEPMSLNIEGHIGGVKGQCDVPVWGQHNVQNLMSAAALALAAGLAPKDVWTGLPQCRSTWGRSQWLRLPDHQPLLFDGYNANPDSFAALLENLAALPHDQEILGVFGDMLELGEFSEEKHRELGKQIGHSSMTQALFMGTFSKEVSRGFAEVRGSSESLMISDTYKEELAKKVQSMLTPKSLVVVKGSRGSGLERFVKALGVEGL